VDAIEVAVVFVFGKVELGLRRGAEDDEDDKPRRARSRLKVENRDSGGNGEELVRFRAWKLVENGSVGDEVSACCPSKTPESMIGRGLRLVELWVDAVLLPGMLARGADA
jgi:hypothetical protein